MTAHRGLDRLIGFFRSSASAEPSLLLSTERAATAQAVVLAYYAALLFLAASNLYSWPAYLAAADPTPRWPVFWLRFVDTRTGIAAILWLHLLAGVLGVAAPRFRFVRILVFAALLEFLAFKYSFGSINHGDHLGLLVAFMLIFLPSGWHLGGAAARDVRAATLLTFSGCQALIMLTYSMAGMWKVGGVVEQWSKGEWVTYLHPRGLAQQVAAKLLEDDATSLLGPWLIEHWWLGWLPGIAALYLELFALWAAARPSLHRAWGLGLVLLHLATHLTMGVGFAQNTLWLALFFAVSPFRPRESSVLHQAQDLPLLGRWLRRPRPPGEGARVSA